MNVQNALVTLNYSILHIVYLQWKLGPNEAIYLLIVTTLVQ